MMIPLLLITVVALAAFFGGLAVPIFLHQATSPLAYQVLLLALPLMAVAVYLDQTLPQTGRMILFVLVLIVSVVTLLLWLTERPS